MSDKEEIAALRARIDQLEQRTAPKPPSQPFIEEPYQSFDPTPRMSMPRSALRAMVDATPDSVVRGIALRDNRAPTGPSSAGAIPSSQQVSNVSGTGGVSGSAREIPLSNPPGTHLVDALCIADDIKQRSKG